MNVLTEMVKPIFSRDWDLEKCPEESLVLFFFWNPLIFELEAIFVHPCPTKKAIPFRNEKRLKPLKLLKISQYLSEKKTFCKATWRFLFPGLSSLQISSKNDQLVMENDGKTDGLGLETWDFQWTGWMFGKKTQKHVAENTRTQKFWGFCWDSFILFPWHSLRFSIMSKNAQRYWHASRHKRSGSGWHTALLSTVPLKQSQTDLWYRAKTYFLLAEMLSKGPNASKVAWQM